MYTAEQVSDLAHDLAALYDLARGIAQPMAQRTMGWPGSSIEDKLREYLESARALAAKFGPESLSVGVGIPFGAEISLTWDVKAKLEGGATMPF